MQTPGITHGDMGMDLGSPDHLPTISQEHPFLTCLPTLSWEVILVIQCSVCLPWALAAAKVAEQKQRGRQEDQPGTGGAGEQGQRSPPYGCDIGMRSSQSRGSYLKSNGEPVMALVEVHLQILWWSRWRGGDRAHSGSTAQVVMTGWQLRGEGGENWCRHTWEVSPQEDRVTKGNDQQKESAMTLRVSSTWTGNLKGPCWGSVPLRCPSGNAGQVVGDTEEAPEGLH